MRQYRVHFVHPHLPKSLTQDPIVVGANTDVHAVLAANRRWGTDAQVGEVYDVTPLPNGTTRRVEVVLGLREDALPGEDPPVKAEACGV